MKEVDLFMKSTITNKVALTKAIEAIEITVPENHEEIIAKLNKMIVNLDRKSPSKKHDYSAEVASAIEVMTEINKPMTATEVANRIGISTSKFTTVVNNSEGKIKRIVNKNKPLFILA